MPTLDVLAAPDLGATLLALLAAIVMGQVLAWHYIRFAKVLSNKRKFARIFVFIACTTLLMISVVKTSLALSLGLVGALSIIRFRTPIKEPEELAYLFLAIAIGVGLGANQYVLTITVVLVVLAYLAFVSSRGADPAVRTILQVALPQSAERSSDEALRRLVALVESHADSVDLRRVDARAARIDASLAIEVGGVDAVAQIVRATEDAFAGAEVSFIERDGFE